MVTSMYRVFSCVAERGCLLWLVRSFGKSLLAFALLHFGLQGQTFQTYQTPGISWLPTFAFQSPMMKRTSFFDLSFRRLVCLHRTVQLQRLCISGWSTELDWSNVKWFSLEMNRDHSVIFEITPISDYSAHYEGYSISSKGFLPAVVYNDHLN